MLGGLCGAPTAGKRPRQLNVPGETTYKKSVTYCAICDGPLFAGKEVAVIGGGNSALDAALQTIKIAAKVYLVNVGDKPGGKGVVRQKLAAREPKRLWAPLSI